MPRDLLTVSGVPAEHWAILAAVVRDASPASLTADLRREAVALGYGPDDPLYFRVMSVAMLRATS